MDHAIHRPWRARETCPRSVGQSNWRYDHISSSTCSVARFEPCSLIPFVGSTAFVLAPFFVHLELLFSAGYRPALHKKIQNEVVKEIAKIKTEEKRAVGDKSTI
jgi:hypothetical protein